MFLPRWRCLLGVALSLLGPVVLGQVPNLLNYQGRVVVGSTNFDGSGQFKFALVNGDGSMTFWSNDGTSSAGSQPTAAVTLAVAKGLYSVQLGSTALANMTAIPHSVFANPDVRLRIWFNDGTNGFQLLTPDQRFVAVGYAMTAATVPDGSITSAKMAPDVTLPGTTVGTFSGSLNGTATGFSGNLAGDVTGTQGATVVSSVGASSAANVHAATQAANAATSANAANTIVKRDASGNITVGTLTATSFEGSGGNLTGITGAMTWVAVAGTSVQADNNTGYIATDASEVTITLPASPDVGDLVRVSGAGDGGWKIAQNAGQSILTGGAQVAGVSSTARESVRQWGGVASSADGTKLVAIADGAQIHTSTDSGFTWTPRDSIRPWSAIASSADGTKLVAGVWNGQLYTSSDSGVTWTPRESSRQWRRIASSADGTKLVAVATGGRIYTSTDSGVSWTPRDTVRDWQGVASSSDGTKLVAVVSGPSGQIYTSTDSGVSWTPRESVRDWHAVASSSDGVKLVAVDHGLTAAGGKVYTSTDSGVTWTSRETLRLWYSVASSADGKRLAAVERNGQVYVSTDSGANWAARESARDWLNIASSADGLQLIAAAFADRLYILSTRTTTGAAGFLSGSPLSAVELQYVGGGRFIILSSSGNLTPN